MGQFKFLGPFDLSREHGILCLCHFLTRAAGDSSDPSLVHTAWDQMKPRHWITGRHKVGTHLFGWAVRNAGASLALRWFWLYALAKLGPSGLAAPLLASTLDAFAAAPADGPRR